MRRPKNQGWAEKQHKTIAKRPRFLQYQKPLTYLVAQLVELVDTLGLEPNARAWGFESLTGHQLFPKGISYKKCERFLKAPSRAGAFFLPTNPTFKMFRISQSFSLTQAR